MAKNVLHQNVSLLMQIVQFAFAEIKNPQEISPADFYGLGCSNLYRDLPALQGRQTFS